MNNFLESHLTTEREREAVRERGHRESCGRWDHRDLIGCCLPLYTSLSSASPLSLFSLTLPVSASVPSHKSFTCRHPCLIPSPLFLSSPFRSQRWPNSEDECATNVRKDKATLPWRDTYQIIKCKTVQQLIHSFDHSLSHWSDQFASCKFLICSWRTAFSFSSSSFLCHFRLACCHKKVVLCDSFALRKTSIDRQQNVHDIHGVCAIKGNLRFPLPSWKMLIEF